VDAYLGEGVSYGTFPVRIDARTYYFGNLDNRHIAFVRGFQPVERADPRSRTEAGDGIVSLRAFNQEATGGLSAYTVSWEPLSASPER
jgi:hypothetical protein